MAETKTTKKQANAGQAKVQKIAKFALLSPFLTYADVVPSKPAKDMFNAHQKHLSEMAKELSPTESA
jgi:hypothetical protein